METRANYILIGLFTLLSILGTLAFFIWLASVQINKQYQTYGVLFEDVSGLDPSGEVLFNGISVGRVIGLRISAEDPSKVLATIEIESDIPIRADTVAQLQSQGVTGVSYISLSGGTLAAAPLIPEGDSPAIIPSRRSTVQTLVEDAPDLLEEATKLLARFQELAGPENQTYVANILRNLDSSSARLDQALNDFSEISGTVQEATAQISQFTDRLDVIGTSVTRTLAEADSTLAAARGTFETAQTALEQSTRAIGSAERVFDEGQIILSDQIPALMAELSETAKRANAALADLQVRSGTALDGFTETSELLNARLAELETTVREANTAFLAVTGASDSFDTLVEGDGALLVAEARVVLADARVAIKTINAVLRDDMPGIIADIRSGVERARFAVDRVAGDVTGLTEQLSPMAAQTREAIESANAVFERARGSLVALDSTLAIAEGALGSAETAFDAATDLLDTDLGPMMSDLRGAAAQIGETAQTVRADIPEITGDLRALIARSDTVARDVQRAVAQATPGIGDFAARGLPELTRLAAEARVLVTTLGNLARRIDKDPARFILDGRVPEYRR